MSIADIYAGRETPSWVIRERATRRVIAETFSTTVVAALNKAKYEAVPILEHLQEINRRARRTYSVLSIARRHPLLFSHLTAHSRVVACR